jgi:hypothetical protein
MLTEMSCLIMVVLTKGKDLFTYDMIVLTDRMMVLLMAWLS